MGPWQGVSPGAHASYAWCVSGMQVCVDGGAGRAQSSGNIARRTLNGMGDGCGLWCL